jgi:hypothetical protein
MRRYFSRTYYSEDGKNEPQRHQAAGYAEYPRAPPAFCSESRPEQGRCRRSTSVTVPGSIPREEQSEGEKQEAARAEDCLLMR